jgi:regulator of protease activity HflC (stomatin/prohibitin superfamily)
LAIFPTNGLEFSIEVTFYWRIKKDELGQLFEKYALTYPTQLESRAQSKMKNEAPNFTIEQYIRERPLITRTLHQVLQAELALIHIECPQRFFSLTKITLPTEIKQRDLEAAVRTQLNTKQQNEQAAELVRKETERQVQEINANATLVGIDAQSTKDRLIEEAYAQGNRTISDSNSLGAQTFFTTLSVTDPVTKAAYIRFYALEESI